MYPSHVSSALDTFLPLDLIAALTTFPVQAVMSTFAQHSAVPLRGNATETISPQRAAPCGIAHGSDAPLISAASRQYAQRDSAMKATRYANLVFPVERIINSSNPKCLNCIKCKYHNANSDIPNNELLIDFSG